MASASKIEWTEQTWNPVTGCTKMSPGCKHCYAETLSKRLQAMGVAGYENGFREISLLHDRLSQPLNRKKPTLYFVNSMSDLFHQKVPFDFIDSVFDVISRTQQHQYQILTKRSGRMRKYFESREVPPNAWLGVSVEDKKYGLPRIRDLQKIDADTRYLSAEPLLENLGKISLKGIHWVIVGGESGSKARPMNEQWAVSIKKQCERAGVDFFLQAVGDLGGRWR